MSNTVDSRYNKLLGPSEKTLICYIIFLDPCCKNNKMQRNFELWDHENYFVISGFFYISVLYNESPLYRPENNWKDKNQRSLK